MLNPYELMYDARMTLYRWQEVKEGGFSKHERRMILMGRPCRYSQSGQVIPGSPNPAIQSKHMLFCGLDVNVHEGDEAEIVLRTGKRIKVKIGECHPYTYQWQCEVERSEDA